MTEKIVMPKQPYEGPPQGFEFCALLASAARGSSTNWTQLGGFLGVAGAAAIALAAIFGESWLFPKSNLVLSAGGGLLLVLMRYSMARADAASLASSGATEALIPRHDDPTDPRKRDELAWQRGLAVRAIWVRSRVEAGQLLIASISQRNGDRGGSNGKPADRDDGNGGRALETGHGDDPTEAKRTAALRAPLVPRPGPAHPPGEKTGG